MITGNSRTLAMASSKGRETPTESLPGSFRAGTPSFERRQKPSPRSAMSVRSRVSFALRSCFFSDGYLCFPVRFAQRTVRILRRGNEGFGARVLGQGLGFGWGEVRSGRERSDEGAAIAMGGDGTELVWCVWIKVSVAAIYTLIRDRVSNNKSSCR